MTSEQIIGLVITGVIVLLTGALSIVLLTGRGAFPKDFPLADICGRGRENEPFGKDCLQTGRAFHAPQSPARQRNCTNIFWSDARVNSIKRRAGVSPPVCAFARTTTGPLHWSWRDKRSVRAFRIFIYRADIPFDAVCSEYYLAQKTTGGI